MVVRGLKYAAFGTIDSNTRTGQQNCFSTCITSVNLNLETDEEELRCWAGDGNCTQQVKQKLVTAETWTLDVETNCFDWLSYQLALGREAVITPTLNLSVPRKGVVGPGGVLNDPSLTSADITTVSVSTNQCSTDFGEERHFTVTATAPANTDEVQLAVGALTFDPSLEGLSVQYCAGLDLTNVETIGYEAGNTLTEMSFSGVLCPYGCDDLSDGVMIVIPRMQLSPNLSLEVADGIGTSTLSYTPVSNGATESPVYFVKLPTGVY